MTAVALITAGPGRAESALCEYRHPDHPSWDFYTSCSLTVEDTAGVTTTRAEVANGSRFTTARIGQGDDVRYTVNDLAAEKLDRGASTCFRTLAEAELVCMHPEGTAPPVAAVATSAPAPASSAMPDGLVLGGGESGYCLLMQGATGAERLIEYGACLRRENCLVGAESGETSCLTDYDWKSGRTSEMARTDAWRTFDGAPVIGAEQGCFRDEAGAITFCFSARAMSAADHAVLAAPAEAPAE